MADTLWGGGQIAKFHMRLLRLTETERGSEGQISHEVIKADRPLPTVVHLDSEIHDKFGRQTPPSFCPP